jgi:hypothetical protein
MYKPRGIDSFGGSKKGSNTLQFREGAVTHKTTKLMFWVIVLVGFFGMIAGGYTASLAPPEIVLDSPPDDSTTTNRYMDLVATVTDGDLDPMTVWFYGGTSNPPTDLLYVEKDVASGTQVTYTWESPVLGTDVNTVALWHFDEGDGDTVYDASGNNNDGVINNVTWTNEGKFGSALVFDGENDYVRVLDDPSLDLTDEVTVEAWVKGQGAGISSVVRQTNIGNCPQLQVVGDKIYYGWTNGSNVYTAEMNTDGTGWNYAQRTSGGGGKLHLQMEVVGDTIWYIWRQSIDDYWQHFLAVMRTDGTGWYDQQCTFNAADHL